MNPSGGLLWHWRAWRSQALWRPTCEQISTSLAQVAPASSELLLIGASAGWMMPSRWLQGSSDSAAFAQAWLTLLGAKGAWLDHLTSTVFEKDTVVNHIGWPFKPDYCHWLQVGWVRH